MHVCCFNLEFRYPGKWCLFPPFLLVVSLLFDFIRNDVYHTTCIHPYRSIINLHLNQYYSVYEMNHTWFKMTMLHPLLHLINFPPFFRPRFGIWGLWGWPLWWRGWPLPWSMGLSGSFGRRKLPRGVGLPQC